MTQPIRQEVRVDYDGQPARDAARDIGAFGVNARKAAEDASQATSGFESHQQALAATRAELVALTREQIAYERAVASGQSVTDQDTAAAGERQQRIEQLAGTLRSEHAVQQRVNDAIRGEAEAVDQVNARNATREQRLAALNQRLQENTREEIRLERAIKEGGDETETHNRQLERRQVQSRRIARVLAEEREAQRRSSQAVADAGEQYRRSGDAGVESFEKVVGGARSLIGALGLGGGLLGALQLVRAEYQLIVDLQEKAFGSQVTLASARRSLRLNLVGQSEERIQEAFAAAGRIAGENDITEAQATQALADTVSAVGGGERLGFAESLTSLGAKVRPDQPEQIKNIGGAIGDIANAIKTDDELLAFGYFLQTAGLSRISDIQQQFRNIPPAVTGLIEQGFSKEAAGSLFGALTTGAADKTGESSGTAAINLGKQLKEFFEGARRPERGGEAIAALQNEPELRARFLADLTLEAKALGPARSLFTDPASVTAVQFQSNLEKFGGSDQLRANARRTLTGLEQGDVEANAAVGRALEAGLNRLQTSDLGGGRAGAIRDKLVEVLNASGEGALAGRISTLDFELGLGDATQRAINLFEQRADALTATTETTIGGNLQPINRPRTPSARDVQRASVLRGLAERLSEIRDRAPSPDPATTPRVIESNDDSELPPISAAGDLRVPGPTINIGRLYRLGPIDGLDHLSTLHGRGA